jgi:hypothetical protein
LEPPTENAAEEEELDDESGEGLVIFSELKNVAMRAILFLQPLAVGGFKQSVLQLH